MKEGGFKIGSLCFLPLSTRFLCRWYVMMTWPYPWAIGYRLRLGMFPPIWLVRLLRVSKRGVLRDTTLVDASLHDEFLHVRQDTDLDLSLAQTTFHVRHLFVSTGHTQTSFTSSRSWRLTRAFLHALLRCADHFNSTRLRLPLRLTGFWSLFSLAGTLMRCMHSSGLEYVL